MAGEWAVTVRGARSGAFAVGTDAFGPDGFESDYAGLTAYFASIRAAFDDRRITQGRHRGRGQHYGVPDSAPKASDERSPYALSR